jgi:hypothetical protein
LVRRKNPALYAYFLGGGEFKRTGGKKGGVSIADILNRVKEFPLNDVRLIFLCQFAEDIFFY